MIQVSILGFDYAFATSIVGVIDLLSTAGTAWTVRDAVGAPG